MGLGQSKQGEEGEVTPSIESQPGPRGTDATYRVGDLLKHTNQSVEYSPAGNIKVVKEELPVPGAFLLHGVLTPEECEQYISISEDMGYGPSPLRYLGEVNSDESTLSAQTQAIRNSERVLLDIPDRIGVPLVRRVEPHLPDIVECQGKQWEVQRLGEGDAKGCLNRRWRFNRYMKEQYFKPHFDAGYVYSDSEKTLMTFILYLSDGLEGGETVFFPGDKRLAWQDAEPGIECRVTPRKGTALVFFQEGKLSPRHEGAPHKTEDAYKYILRTDIAYKLYQEPTVQTWQAIVGIGSLLSIASARSTCPSLRHFQLCRVRGWRRIFAHTAPIFFERGIARVDTMEISSLSTEECDGETFLGTYFEIPSEEVAPLLLREAEFRFETVVVELQESGDKVQALMCCKSTDEAYTSIHCKRVTEKASTCQCVACTLRDNWNIESIWRDDVLPTRIYARHCVLAAQNLGEHVHQDFLDHTFLADRSTSLRTHLERDPSIMDEGPPESLANRYSG